MIGSTALFVAAFMAQSTAADPAKVGNVDPQDKVTCRREAPIGSLIPSKKTCHTRREWETLNANARRDVETLRDRSSAYRNE